MGNKLQRLQLRAGRDLPPAEEPGRTAHTARFQEGSVWKIQPPWITSIVTNS